MTRESEFDVMRGILVLLVVLGHVIQQIPEVGSSWGKPVSDVLYSFHMPAFVFVSGLCAVKILTFSGVRESLAFVGSRARRTLVPYVVWGGLYLGLRAVLGEHAREPYDLARWPFFFLGYNPDGAMWFLWTLFGASAAGVACAPFLRRGVWARLATVAAVVAVLWLLSDVVGGYAYRAGYAPPIARGVCALWVFTLLFLVGVLFRPAFAALKKRPLALGLLATVATVAFVLCQFGRTAHVLPSFPWFAPSSVCAAFALLSASTLLVRFSAATTKLLSCLGVYAMAIYVLGEPVKVAGRIAVRAVGLSPAPAFVLLFAATLVVPMLLRRFVVSRSRILSLALLGR